MVTKLFHFQKNPLQSDDELETVAARWVAKIDMKTFFSIQTFWQYSAQGREGERGREGEGALINAPFFLSILIM